MGSPRKHNILFALAFTGTCIAGVFVHEIGHATAGWVQGIPAIPTPAKEYLLRDHVEWRQMVWISLGGVLATVLLVVGALLWYIRERRPLADAFLAGVLLTPILYTVRFLLAGRGHDGMEWQQAQSALGLAVNGHAVDFMFAGLVLAEAAVWVVRRRDSLRPTSVFRLVALIAAGIVLLMSLQVTNNALFDRFFPETAVINGPSGSEPK